MGRARLRSRGRAGFAGRVLWLFPFVSQASLQALSKTFAADESDLIVEFEIVGGRRVNTRIP